MNSSKLNNSLSPWQDKNQKNLFRTELSWAKEPIAVYGYECHSALKWVNDNNASDLLFKGLAKVAPLCPVAAYKGGISAYVSPPPSGSANTVLLILGKDQSGKVRLVGSNFSCWPREQSGLVKTNFFTEFDKLSNCRDQESLIIETISSHMTFNDLQIAKQVAYQSELFRTMPVALLVLYENQSHMAFSPAVVYGDHPSDMSLEYMGEIL